MNLKLLQVQKSALQRQEEALGAIFVSLGGTAGADFPGFSLRGPGRIVSSIFGRAFHDLETKKSGAASLFATKTVGGPEQSGKRGR